MRWKPIEGITQSDLGLRWLSLAVVWKLDQKRAEQTKRTNIVKGQARNEGGLGYSSVGGVMKSGCNPDVQESLVSINSVPDIGSQGFR